MKTSFISFGKHTCK